QRFLAIVRDFLAFAIPAYEAEGKTRLTIAIGCTGGYHRSITIAEELATELRAAGHGPVSVWHRELDKA
ncbi:MAG: RNase adaptor protein RapZ, partial [Candidatus Limnocylindrales bacterium]